MSDTDQDPSIEEILASIRQIISDDDEEESPVESDVESEPQSDPILEQDAIDDVMELTNRVDDSALPSAVSETVSADDLDALFDTPSISADPIIEEEDITLDMVDEFTAPEPIPEPVPTAAPAAAPEPIPEPPKASAPVTPAPSIDMPSVDMPSINAPAGDEILTPIARAAVENAYAALSRHTPISNHPAGTSLEDVIRSMLSPLLRQWLDVNLPPIIEKIVREELEKIAQKNL